MVDMWYYTVFFIIITLRIVLVFGISSKYVQTGIYTESSDCVHDEFNLMLEETPVKSMVQCGVKCTLNENCRRFLFDKVSRVCTLYQSGENCITVAQKVPHSICYMQKKLCNKINCTRCPIGFYGENCQNVITDCSDGVDKGVVPIIRTISYVNFNGLMEIKCDFTSTGFSIILHRTMRCLPIDFNRTFANYSSGFGRRYGNYWLGFQNIKELLELGNYKYHIRAQKTNGAFQECVYSTFEIGNAADGHRITIGGYTKPPGGLVDALTNYKYNINGHRFSTIDKDYSDGCPDILKNGGWFLNKSFRACPKIKVNIDHAQWYDRDGNVANFLELQFRLQKT